MIENKKIGITLIALIITIVILLILATVTVMEVKETNIFSKARTGVKQYSKYQEEEKLKLDNEVKHIEKWTNTNDNVQTKPEESNNEKIKPVKPEKLEIGDYIQYNVEYIDVFNKTNFTKNTGWRVLNPGRKNSNGKYDGVEIIPTGIPVELYYAGECIKDATGEKDSYPWKGTASEIEEIKNTFDYEKVGDDSGVMAAAGLRNHIDKVQVLTENEIGNQDKYKEGKGSRKKIVNDGVEIQNEQNLSTLLIIPRIANKFKYPDLDMVKNMANEKLKHKKYKIGTDRDLEYEDVSYQKEDDPAIGFWNICDLSIGNYSHSNSSVFWLANPSSEEGNCMKYMGNNAIRSAYGDHCGLRPIICLNDNVDIVKLIIQGN